MIGYCKNCRQDFTFEDSEAISRKYTALIIRGGRAHNVVYGAKRTKLLQQEARPQAIADPEMPVTAVLQDALTANKWVSAASPIATRQEIPTGIEEASESESLKARATEEETDIYGTVTEFDSDRRFLIVASQEKEYFVPTRQCKKPLGHDCFFYELGRPVILDVRSQPMPFSRRPEATNVRLADPTFYTQCENQMIGTVRMRSKDGFGFIQRSCGCELFFFNGDILSTAEALGDFGPGSEVLFNTFQERDGRFKAVQIEIFKKAEEKGEEVNDVASGQS